MRRNLLTRYGQAPCEFENSILGKRQGDGLDNYEELNRVQDLGYESKRAKMGEMFETCNDFFALDD